MRQLQRGIHASQLALGIQEPSHGLLSENALFRPAYPTAQASCLLRDTSHRSVLYKDSSPALCLPGKARR